jgi:hypothetical protein
MDEDGKGVFIVVGRRRLRHGVTDNLREGVNRGDSVSSEKSRPRKKKTGNRGPHVGEEKRDQGYRFGFAGKWAMGRY